MIAPWERVLVLAPHTDDGEFGCAVRRSGEGEGGNREVPPVACLGGDAEVWLREGGPWGKQGFPHAKSPASMGGAR